MTLLEKYKRQVIGSRNRGIAWEFTYETWLKWWTDTGKLDQRGRKSNEYCMCRIGDKGPYSPDNVFCATNADNNRDAVKNGVKPFGGYNLGFIGNHSKESRKKISENNAMNLTAEVIAERISIYKSMDMNKWGSIGRFGKAIGLSHTSAKRFIDKHINAPSDVLEGPTERNVQAL